MGNEAPDLNQVYEDPHKGDLLCYDGKKWCVARRDGWHYPVPDPETANTMEYVKGEDGVFREAAK